MMTTNPKTPSQYNIIDFDLQNFPLSTQSPQLSPTLPTSIDLHLSCSDNPSSSDRKIKEWLHEIGTNPSLKFTYDTIDPSQIVANYGIQTVIVLPKIETNFMGQNQLGKTSNEQVNYIMNLQSKLDMELKLLVENQDGKNDEDKETDKGAREHILESEDLSNLKFDHPIITELDLPLNFSFDQESLCNFKAHVEDLVEGGAQGLILNDSIWTYSSVGWVQIMRPLDSLKKLYRTIKSIFDLEQGDSNTLSQAFKNPSILLKCHGLDTFYIRDISCFDDHPYLLGATQPIIPLVEAISQGLFHPNFNMDCTINSWRNSAQPSTLRSAFLNHLLTLHSYENANNLFDIWLNETRGNSITDQLERAKQLGGQDLFWDHSLCRTLEGFYPISTALDDVADRILEVSQYVDGYILTNYKEASLTQISALATKIKARYPALPLAYQFPSSEAQNLPVIQNHSELMNFAREFVKMGIGWFLISWPKKILTQLSTDPFTRVYFKEKTLDFISNPDPDQNNHLDSKDIETEEKVLMTNKFNKVKEVREKLTRKVLPIYQKLKDQIMAPPLSNFDPPLAQYQYQPLGHSLPFSNVQLPHASLPPPNFLYPNSSTYVYPNQINNNYFPTQSQYQYYPYQSHP